MLRGAQVTVNHKTRTTTPRSWARRASEINSRSDALHAERQRKIQDASLAGWKAHGQLVDGLEWLPDYAEDPHDVQELVNSAVLGLLDTHAAS